MLYVGNLFAFFFKGQENKPIIKIRSHRVALFEAFSIRFFLLGNHITDSSCFSTWRTSSLNLSPSLGCLNVANTESELCFRRNYKPRYLGPEYMLSVAAVQVLQVFGVYSGSFEWKEIYCCLVAKELPFCLLISGTSSQTRIHRSSSSEYILTSVIRPSPMTTKSIIPS